MNQHVVVAHLKHGMIVKAVGLSWDAAHDLRESLESTGIYEAVSVGAVGSYFYGSYFCHKGTA